MTCHEIQSQAEYDEHADEPGACLHISKAVTVGDKIKARSCEVLYEVDIDGNRLPEPAAEVTA